MAKRSTGRPETARTTVTSDPAVLPGPTEEGGPRRLPELEEQELREREQRIAQDTGQVAESSDEG